MIITGVSEFSDDAIAKTIIKIFAESHIWSLENLHKKSKLK